MKYRPSNGIEGVAFWDQFCGECERLDNCRILPKTMTTDVDDPEYPSEWTYDGEGEPTCTAFKDAS